MKRNISKKQWIAISVIAAVLLLIVILWQTLGASLTTFLSNPEALRTWVEKKGWSSRIVFGAMIIFQIIVAVIPGEPFEIAAGYAFGWLEGTVLCIVSAAIGSIITFGLVRKFGMKLVRIFFSEEQVNSVRFLKTNEKRDFLFLVIYMLPGTPKDLLGYFAGLTDLPFPVFCLICSLGRMPSLITSTIGGNALGTQRYGTAIIVFVITLAVSGLGLLIYNRICKKSRGKHSPGKGKGA